ncbi:MAG: SAM-dependent chlorinase/fluorinase, partial [Pirellulales bacterium]|nr:SAM-dependent chlorinase/fluorinase [Pirellulales bacterium]
MNAISLTTDFGTRDWFVGAMKGVIAGIAPKARVIDVTHEITPGDPRGGAFALAAACEFFPRGTVHVAVVDPGVGGARRPVAIRTRRFVFIGPDNGVLWPAATRDGVKSVRELANRRMFPGPVSMTFHGRDIFCPVAARLASGAAFSKVGPKIDDPAELTLPAAERLGDRVAGEVTWIDRFGNLITNIPTTDLREFAGAGGTVSASVGKRRR